MEAKKLNKTIFKELQLVSSVVNQKLTIIQIFLPFNLLFSFIKQERI